MEFITLGLCSYQQGLEIQRERHAQCVAGLKTSAVFLLEHFAVVTLGKHANLHHLLLDSPSLNARGVALCASDRGGEVTAHMPGQLVVYPIFSFKDRPLGVKTYIHLLEEVVIATLAEFGLASQRDLRNPGVWIGGKKICALGIRISQRVSLHGLALNIANDLSLFTAMHPCGLINSEVTSMSQQLGRVLDLEPVAGVFTQQFKRVFDCARPLPTKP